MKTYSYKNRELVNLTPHDVIFLDDMNQPEFTIPGSENPLRMREHIVEDDGLIIRKRYTIERNIPEVNNRIYVVSLVVAKYIERADFAVPDVIRDSRNHIIGCKKLIRAGDNYENRN